MTPRATTPRRDDKRPRCGARPRGRSRLRTNYVLVLLAMLAACSTLPTRTADRSAERLLFVGNSLTYVGNLPAVFSGLTHANGQVIDSDMIVVGGATLSERVRDGSVAKALNNDRYLALVLQERGGDLVGAFGPEAAAESRQAIKQLADLAAERGVPILMLGGYQPNPDFSQRLVEAESVLAKDVGIDHVEVSETLRRLRETSPGRAWFAASDDPHPGADLTLLMAVLLHRALLGALPEPVELTVNAPIYGSHSGLTASLRRSDEPPPNPETPRLIHYRAVDLKTLIDDLDVR